MEKVNGRINILHPNTNTLFNMFDKIPVNECTTYRDAMQGGWNETPLSDAFFSSQNIQILQNGIRAGVHNLSGNKFIVAQQSIDDLKIIMRSIFLQNSGNQPNKIPEQIAALNKLVLNYCVPKIYKEAIGYIRYRHDASTIAPPIAAPISTKSNNNTLELKPFF
tara:strand:+ start:241 stop:732 length:492 start_codon:yes stop_codon:yes gene_type:complete